MLLPARLQQQMERDDLLAMLQACRELGTAYVAFSPLARGLLGGDLESVGKLERKDIRRTMSRFASENYAANLKLLDGFHDEAIWLSCAAATLALAWLLHQGEDIIPIPGTSKPEHLRELNAAPQLTLDVVTLQRLDALINRHTISGARYNATTQTEIVAQEF